MGSELASDEEGMLLAISAAAGGRCVRVPRVTIKIEESGHAKARLTD